MPHSGKARLEAVLDRGAEAAGGGERNGAALAASESPEQPSNTAHCEVFCETLQVRSSGACSLGISIFKAPGQHRGGARLESPFVVVSGVE